MDKESHLIYETYQNLDEGVFDRLKARSAQAVGAIKGAGNRIAGTAKGAVAGMKGDTAGVLAAQTQKQQGAIQSELAKIQSYRQTAMAKFKGLSDEVFGDMAKLGIDVKKISPNSINVFTSALDKAFDALVTQIQTDTTKEAPPPITAPAPSKPGQPTTVNPGGALGK